MTLNRAERRELFNLVKAWSHVWMMLPREAWGPVIERAYQRADELARKAHPDLESEDAVE